MSEPHSAAAPKPSDKAERAEPYTSAVAAANRRNPAAAVALDDRQADDHVSAGRTTGEVEIDTSLSCENLAVVREQIAQALTHHDEDFVIDVQLVATELAANACDHADDPRSLVLRREVHTDRSAELVIEARDATVNSEPVVGVSRIGPHRGNGMKLVESLCNDWGVRHDSDTKIVWARLPMPLVTKES